MRLKVFMFVLLVSIIFVYAVGNVNAQDQIDINVVWRWDTGQYYGFDQYSQLASDLADNGVNVSYYNVTELFNSSEVPVNIFGDPTKTVIVIPNPPSEFSSKEKAFLKSFLEAGGGIILMNDIQYDDRHYGKPDYLNDLLQYIGVYDLVHFWGTNDNGDEIKDETNNIGYPWQVVVTSDYFAPTIVAAGIEKVVINSASLWVSDNKYVLATTPPTSYAEDTKGEVHSVGNIPWLASVDVGEGKLVLCGSSKMFSDRPPYGSSVPFIKQANNEQLFFNLIWYLTGQRLVAPQPIPLIGVLDIFPVIAGMIGALLYRDETGKINYRIFSYVAIIIGSLFALAASIQVAIFGQVIIGSGLPGWGEIVKAKGESMPSELVAFTKYFMAGVVEAFVGLFLIMIIEAIDNYLDLGIMRRLGVKKEEVS